MLEITWLESIWFVLWGVLWIIYFILDGFDLGLGALMPALAKDDQDKRIIYNAMGPFWDGNEVWLITAGGVTFAAFPGTYAVMFSSLYSAFIASAALFGVVGLYPRLLPSSLDPAASMTIANSASSPLTLKIMLGVSLIMVPVVIIYQAWVYKKFGHKIHAEDLAYDEAY